MEVRLRPLEIKKCFIIVMYIYHQPVLEKENMKCYYTFDELPKKRGYGIVFKKIKN